MKNSEQKSNTLNTSVERIHTQQTTGKDFQRKTAGKKYKESTGGGGGGGVLEINIADLHFGKWGPATPKKKKVDW